MNGKGNPTVERRDHPRIILASASKNYQTLIQSDPAMDILCEKFSVIREDANKVAHPNVAPYHEIVSSSLLDSRSGCAI